MTRPRLASLEDLIDFKDVERLLEQHDRYEWQDCSICRTNSFPRRYFVYYKGLEIHAYEKPGVAEPKGFDSFAEGLEAAIGFMVRLEDGEIK